MISGSRQVAYELEGRGGRDERDIPPPCGSLCTWSDFIWEVFELPTAGWAGTSMSFTRLRLPILVGYLRICHHSQPLARSAPR
jgi:hypothetical protein